MTAESELLADVAVIQAALIDEEPELGALDLGFSALRVVLSDYADLLRRAADRDEHADPESAWECHRDATAVLEKMRPIVRKWVDAANAKVAVR